MDLRDWLSVGIAVLIIIGIIAVMTYWLVIFVSKTNLEVFEEKVQIIEQHNLKPELVKILINGETKEE